MATTQIIDTLTPTQLKTLAMHAATHNLTLTDAIASLVVAPPSHDYQDGNRKFCTHCGIREALASRRPCAVS